MKQLSAKIKNRVLRKILLSTPGMIVTNWFFQGTRYMNSFEIFHRLSIEIMIIIVFFSLFRIFMPSAYPIVFSFIVSHTIMWLVNGHFFALTRIKGTRPKRFIDYTDGIYKRLARVDYLKGVAIFGGISKWRFNEYSDIDLRVIKSSGFFNSVRACNYALLERIRAFKNHFPFEVYVFGYLRELDKEDKTQVSPIILHDPEKELRNKYPEGKEYPDFRKGFISRFVK